MADDPIKEYENIKDEIEELKLKRLSDLREKERLEQEFEALKAEIKSIYGVEIEDFEKAIEDLKSELQNSLELLKKKIADCKSQMGV